MKVMVIIIMIIIIIVYAKLVFIRRVSVKTFYIRVCGDSVWDNGDTTTTTTTAVAAVLSATFQNPWACDIYCFGGSRIILRVPYRQTRLLLIKSKGRSIDFFFLLLSKNLCARNKRARTITTVYQLYRYSRVSGRCVCS